jgi:para-nitrobenzyl esterase
MLRGLPCADPHITSYKGIPFAAPPLGNLRWHAPMPAGKWDGLLKAYEFAPISMQPVPGEQNNIYTAEWNVDPDIPISEDCLYLNIWTPANKAGEKLPVFIWFFGGAFIEGNTREMEFNCERIARRGIVVVTVNYRVNCFGFLCHPEITAENPAAPANFGLLDQKAGMEWAKRNIAAFGGDPLNISIGGQSAGGGSVSAHLTSPQTEGLFVRAIMMSALMLPFYGEGGPRMDRNLSLAEETGKEFFEFLGVKTLSEARKLDAFFIRDKTKEYRALKMQQGIPFIWGPVSDGKYLLDNSMKMLFENKRKMVPLMAGHTIPEFPYIADFKSMPELEAFAKKRFDAQADAFMAAIKGHYFEDTLAKASYNSIELGVKALFRATQKTANPPPCWYYLFDGDIPGDDNPGGFHSVDLWFWFETLAASWRPFTGKHYDLARRMCNYMCNFIKSGNPNGNDQDGSPMPQWKPYSECDKPFVLSENCWMGTEAEKPVITFALANL